MKYRLLDRIIEVEPNRRITGRVCPSFEMSTLKRPGQTGFFPSTLLLESLQQLCLRLIHVSTDFRSTPLLASLPNVQWDGEVPAGAQVDLEATLLSFQEDRVEFRGTASVNGKTVLRVDNAYGFVVPTQTLMDIETARIEYDNLCGRYALTYGS